MQLLVIRHGSAEDAGRGVEDSQRALTDAGKKEMKQVSAGLTALVENVDVIAASPLVRAQQTAEIVAKAYDDLEIHTLEALSPGSDLDAIANWLRQQASAEVIAVVGHEPDLGTLVTWLMTGAGNSRVAFSKGGAALLEFPSRVASGGATLEWLLTRSQLRRIGR
jgi:phosphohistidine phosphatase